MINQKLINASPIFIVALIFWILIEGASPDRPPTAVARAKMTLTTPYPTQMIVMNAATATAIAPTPRPTLIPAPEPTLIPNSYAPGGEMEATSSIWFTRGFIIAGAIFVVWVVFMFREIKLYEIETKHIEKLAEIEALEKLKINPRPIVSSKVDGDYVKLANGRKVKKQKISKFIRVVTSETNNELGLTISKWKKLDGWEQADIENILDQLAAAMMVTKRENGRCCQWLIEPDKRSLSHVFRLSPFEI